MHPNPRSSSRPFFFAIFGILFTGLLGLSSCSSTALRPLSLTGDRLDPSRAYVLVQFQVSPAGPSQRLTFEDSQGKQYVVQTLGTESQDGVLVELPPRGYYAIRELGTDTDRFRLDGKPVSATFHARPGKINHVGIWKFEALRKEGKTELWVSSERDPRKIVKAYERAISKHALRTSSTVNAYTGKPLPISTGPGGFQFFLFGAKEQVSGKTFSPPEKAYHECWEEEKARNEMLFGVFELEILVRENRVVRIEGTKSAHTGSTEFEKCLVDVFRRTSLAGTEIRVVAKGI